MKIKVFFLLLIICCISLHTVRSQTGDTGNKVDEYLSARTELGKFSGAILIARNGKLILRKGYGFADLEKRIPYTPETKHEIASISKMFTSMAALQLRDKGKLKLEDSICKYIDDCPEAWQQVAVRNLMLNTSGIHDYEETLDFGSDKYFEAMTKPDAARQIFEDAKKMPLDFKPGDKFNYSNTGYIVLSYVVQKAAGISFADYIRKNILKPAGMKNSGVLGTGNKPRNLAYGYTFGDIGWEKTLAGYPLTAGHLKRVPQLPLTPPAGDGGLYSTLDDLYRWSQVMDGSNLVSASLAKEVFTFGLGGYGYGWMRDEYFDRRRIRHTGSLPGYTSQLVKFPDDKITVVVLCNLDRALMGRIMRDITAILFGKPYDMPVHGQLAVLTAAQISNLEGDYKMPGGEVLSIKNDPRFLMAEIKGQFTAGLIPMSPSEFYFPLSDGKAIFTLGENGKAVKVNLRYGGEDHIGNKL